MPPIGELDSLASVIGFQFVQRWDLFARQLDDGRYICVKEKLRHEMIIDHLTGEVTLGMYLLDKDSRGRHIVFDADNSAGWRRLVALQMVLSEMNIVSYLEKSRRGGHLWFFFEELISAKLLRQFAKGLMVHFGIGGLELFPKQAKLARGPGSLIRLPFGIHRKSGMRYGFYKVNGQPLGERLRDQLRLLGEPLWVAEDVLSRFVALSPKKQGIESGITRESSTDDEDSRDLPIHERIKGAISARNFISQYVELSPSGVGLCPLHDDHAESFSVNDANNFWYCFACEKGGSIIDFWMNYRECEFNIAVRELETLLL